MSTPSAEKCEFYYPLKTNSADGQAATQRTCEAGTDAENLVNSGLTQADDYWNGAIGRFDPATATAALRNKFFHVKDFVAATDKLVLSRPLPATPATGGGADTFRLFFGGNWRSTEEVPGMSATAPVNITGVTIDKVAFENEEGNGSLEYISASTELSWQAPGDAAVGPSVDVSINGTYVLFSENQDKWIEVTVVAASLPVGDETDAITLTNPLAHVLPDWEGYETDAAPKERYHLVVIKNADGSNAMADVRAYVLPDTPGTPTTLVDGIGTGADDGEVTDASDWPLRSFWVYNVDKDDVRYVKYRSGNHLYYGAAGGGLRDFTAVAWDAADAVEVYPEVDIGLDAPAADQFENPASEETAPGAVTFDAPQDYDTGLAIGSLASDDIYGIWIREIIIAGVISRENYTNLLKVEWR